MRARECSTHGEPPDSRSLLLWQRTRSSLVVPKLHDILQGKQRSLLLADASQQPSGLSMAGAVRIVQCLLTVPRLMKMLPTCSTR